MPVLRNAILVAGHAVLRDPNRLESDDGWFLLDFQKGEPPKYLEHIERGISLAAEDPEALLVFTGTQTRVAAGARSEAASYYWAADLLDWFGFLEVQERTVTEEYARDSFENLLFGICRFCEVAGAWPEQVTVVSWEFKRRRFGLHREAIRWPEARFEYSAPNDPSDIGQALEAEALAIQRYSADPYSAGDFFRRKREERNPFRLTHGYRESSPELRELFGYAGPARFAGALPWDAATT
jgi:hypothetical protein